MQRWDILQSAMRLIAEPFAFIILVSILEVHFPALHSSRTPALHSSMPSFRMPVLLIDCGACHSDPQSKDTLPSSGSLNEDPHACLKMTTNNLYLSYPQDAEIHFEHINARLAPWQTFVFKKTRQKYHRYHGWDGPWIESEWTRMIEKLWSDRTLGTRLLHLFGPYIPIAVPLLDIASVSWDAYELLLRDLEALLRPEVPYVILVQHDDGLAANHHAFKHMERNHPNLLVFSAGGYGHIPVPLPLRPMHLVLEKKPAKERQFFANYVGTIGHAPHKLREKVVKSMASFAASHPGLRIFTGPSEHWQSIMIDSKVSMAPRGFGRTAFHVLEALQMGLIPVHVYEDVPWVPYAEIFSKIAFSIHVSEVESFLAQLQKTNDSTLDHMEAKVVALRESHFMIDGVMEQILRFITKNGTSDLRCQVLPTTARGV